MKLNIDKLKSNQILIGKNGLVVDNTRVPVKEKIQPISLTQEQQQNFKLYGSLNKPEVKQTYLNQGRKLTPAEQQASNKKLAEQGKLQAYQKQQEQDAKNLEKAVEVAPYVIPGIGQAMWAGKAVDLATNKMSDGKYKSWSNMVDQKTGSGEFIGDLTNPGYMIGGVSQVLKKPISRLTNIPRRNLAISEYITPFGYEGKGKEVKKFLTDYVIKGKDKPDISWMTTRSQYDPVRAELRGEAWRKYLNVSKESDKLYIKNSDGTFRYNPEVIPKENIEFQRQAFSKAGNGNSSKEYLTEQLQSAEKGFVGNAGGVTSIIDDARNFTIKDTWDLMPLQRFKWLPKKIQNIEVGKVVGAKPFIVVDDQIGKVSSNFKSEINWGNWNKEIPSNKPLMDEYLQIENAAKQNGTWMKNSDGSSFQGTPEQFVQQNSKNFKKAYPQNAEITYRGIKNNTPDLLNNSAIFTADKRLAKTYTTNNEILTPFSTVDDKGLYEMYRKKSDNGIELDVRGSHWKNLNISNKIIPRSYFKKQIGNQKNNLKYNNSRLSDHNLDVAEIPYLLNNKKHLENELKYFQDGLLNRKDMINRKGVTNLKKHFKNLENTSTNDIAKYVENKNLDYIKLKNVSDNLIGTETIVNHKPGNYLKSAIGNNGMFDMLNPNIYKGLIPAAGLYGLTQSKKQGGVIKAQEGGFFNKIVKSKEYNSPLATALKIVDPTGISSYGDVYNAWTDGKFDYNDIIEPLGAIPVFGKLGKTGKFLLKGIKGIEDFNNAKKIIKSSKFVNSDVINTGGRTFKTSFNKKFVSPYTFQEYQSAKKFIKGNPLLNYSQYGVRTIAGIDDILDIKNQGKDFLTSVQNKSAKKQEGGLLERKGVPFTAPKPIQPEFPYNGQSMYKGGYNLKRALELYKPDNTGHLPSVDSETGEWLKDKDYPTAWKELMSTTLNLNLNKQVGFPILNTNGRLQYINK